jgi:hypothetical protein
MTEYNILGVLLAAVVYAPFIVAYGAFRDLPGGGVWKFLTFVFCTLTVAAAFTDSFGMTLVLWLIAWVLAGIMRQTARREAVDNKALSALQEQNELLKKQLLTIQRSHSATLPETLPLTEHFAVKGEGSSLH